MNKGTGHLKYNSKEQIKECFVLSFCFAKCKWNFEQNGRKYFSLFILVYKSYRNCLYYNNQAYNPPSLN
jgi:hypothetical protein